MKLAFGYSVAEHDDFFVQAAEESSKISGFALAPGRWLVESYPLRKPSTPALSHVQVESEGTP